MMGKKIAAAKARDEPCSANEEVAKLRFEMREHSLEELEEAGLVRVDTDEEIVRKGPNFDGKKPD